VGAEPDRAFVLQVLESKNLAPSKEADRRTLLRRLSLDLTGLPPTPAEVRRSSRTGRPTPTRSRSSACLASPHYGERMAVPWLDAVRFADTVGFHGDQYQNVFPYRDYVINALTPTSVRPLHVEHSPATCCPTRRPSSSSRPGSTG
jgi:hypothetical protein